MTIQTENEKEAETQEEQKQQGILGTYYLFFFEVLKHIISVLLGF